MKKGLIGKKIGMTQIFDEKGNVIPVTVVEAGPCVITQKKTIENDGYEAVQVGFGDVKAQRVNKAMKGHFAKNDVAPKKVLKEFRLENIADVNVGDILKADVFAAGDKVDVMAQARVTEQQVPSSVGTSQDSESLMVQVPLQDMPVHWVLVQLLPVFTRERSLQVTTV